MISRFFIHHPVFASALSLLIVFAGLVAMKNLPIEQYPNITPPLIQLSATYNGANADTMADDVASPLEQQILGVENMIYMYSQNSSSGTMTLDIYFAIGSNADMAQGQRPKPSEPSNVAASDERPKAGRFNYKADAEYPPHRRDAVG